MIQLEQCETTAPPEKKGSPWSHLGRGLTGGEWAALKAWKAENPKLKWRLGDTRSDGRRFFVYSRAHCGGEKWLSEESFKKMQASLRAGRKRLREKFQANRRKKYHDNQDFRDSIRRKTREWYMANKPKANAAKRKWWRKKYYSDPEFRRRSLEKANLRNKKLGRRREKDAKRRFPYAIPSCAPLKRIYAHASEISKRTGEKLDVDHIIPVSRGGVHAIGNLQLLPREVNRAKGDNPFWMSSSHLDWRNVPRPMWPEKLRPEYERLIALHPRPIHAIRVR